MQTLKLSKLLVIEYFFISSTVLIREILTSVGKLFAIDSIIKHSLMWYIQEELLEGQDFNYAFDMSVADVVPHWKVLIGAYNIPEEILYCPAAQDWIAFNADNNLGEITRARL